MLLKSPSVETTLDSTQGLWVIYLKFATIRHPFTCKSKIPECINARVLIFAEELNFFFASKVSVAYFKSYIVSL